MTASKVGECRPVLVTGGAGMLGAAFAEQAHVFPQFDMRAPGRAELDVRDAVAMDSWTDWAADGWVVHCAAMVDVEGCAREPEAAREVIVDGARNAALLARRAGARLLYPQSFLTYDGATNPIGEDEVPRPLSLYGQLKYEAEQVAREILDDALIIRMAGFFGGEAADKNFVGRIIPAMRSAIDRGQSSFDVGDRVWQPTWTKDLAFNSLDLMATGSEGSYQMACLGHAAFHEIAAEIVMALGWSERLRIVPVNAGAISGNELGRRPDTAILSCSRLTHEGRNLQRSWRSTLRAYLNAPYFNKYRLEVVR